MDRLSENKIVLIVRETRLEELKAKFNTTSQARFYVEQLGGDFGDYEEEDRVYQRSVREVQQVLGLLGRVHTVPRRFLPNFLFGRDDVVVAIGQDGLVANTLKYLHEQPLIGVNPDPARYDGKLLPFRVADLGKVVGEHFKGKRPVRRVTMAKASLLNGQTLYAVNDLFIGPKSHGSARYVLRHGGVMERQSSSGIIVSTGLGSTGWMASVLAGALGVVNASRAGQRSDPSTKRRKAGGATLAGATAWDAPQLVFAVREPFPSQTTQTELVYGRIEADSPLVVESSMPERGVIFSDGFEADFIEFTSGMRAEISIAERVGRLVV